VPKISWHQYLHLGMLIVEFSMTSSHIMTRSHDVTSPLTDSKVDTDDDFVHRQSPDVQRVNGFDAGQPPQVFLHLLIVDVTWNTCQQTTRWMTTAVICTRGVQKVLQLHTSN